MPFTVCKYLHWCRRYLSLKIETDANEMTDNVKHPTEYYIKYINSAILVNLQQKPFKLAKLIVPMATHSFPVPFNLILIF